jgi:hypothetical protein
MVEIESEVIYQESKRRVFMCPIEGVSDIVRLPRLGKVRLGIKVQGKESEYPQRVDWFVCPELLRQSYGERPTTLPIMFPSSDPEVIAPQYYKCYRRTYGLVCKGDGKACHAKIDTATGTLADRNTTDWEYKEMQCEGEDCPEFREGNCKRVMTLLFVLHELAGLGVYQLDTSNRNSIINANSFIFLLNRLTRGRFAMVPLKMSLLKEERQTRDGKRNICCLVFNKDDIKPMDLLKGVAGPNLLVEATDEDEPPGDLFPPNVIDGTTVKPAAAAPGAAAGAPGAAAGAPAHTGPAAPPPAGDKRTRSKVKPTKGSPSAPLCAPELIEAWKKLRDLQKETSVTDGMMRGGFRKAYPEVNIPKSALPDIPPPWVTVPMIQNMTERLKSYKQSLQTVKEFSQQHVEGSLGQTPAENKSQASSAEANKRGGDQGPGKEVLDI